MCDCNRWFVKARDDSSLFMFTLHYVVNHHCDLGGSMLDVIHLNAQVISTNQLTIANPSALGSPVQLDHRQNAIHKQIMLALQKRNEHYDCTEYYCEDSSTEDSEVHSYNG